MKSKEEIKRRAIVLFMSSLKSHSEDLLSEIPKKNILQYKKELDRKIPDFSMSQKEAINHIYRKDHALLFYSEDREEGLEPEEALAVLRDVLDEVSSLILHTCSTMMSQIRK